MTFVKIKAFFIEERIKLSQICQTTKYFQLEGTAFTEFFQGKYIEDVDSDNGVAGENNSNKKKTI